MGTAWAMLVVLAGLVYLAGAVYAAAWYARSDWGGFTRLDGDRLADVLAIIIVGLMWLPIVVLSMSFERGAETERRLLDQLLIDARRLRRQPSALPVQDASDCPSTLTVAGGDEAGVDRIVHCEREAHAEWIEHRGEGLVW